MHQEEQLYWTISKLILGILAVAFFLIATTHAQSQVVGPNRVVDCGYHLEKVAHSQ